MIEQNEQKQKLSTAEASSGANVMRLHAKWRRTGEKVKILLMEFDNNGYMQSITIRFDNKFHKKFYGYKEIELVDQNGNEIILYSESCDSIVRRGITT